MIDGNEWGLTMRTTQTKSDELTFKELKQILQENRFTWASGDLEKVEEED